MQPILSMPAGGMRGLNIALALGTAGLLVGGIGALVAWPDAGASIWISLAMGLLALTVVFLILPLRYEVWPDRLRLVFRLWRWDLTYDSIERIEWAKWWQSYAFIGVRFATSPAQSIAVFRRNSRLLVRPHIVFSPDDGATFFRILSSAISEHGNRTA